MDKVLPETDGPFAMNGKVPFMPWDAMSIVGTIASIWKTTEQQASDQMIANLSVLLNNANFSK